MSAFIPGFTKDMMKYAIYPLEAPGRTRVINSIGKGIFSIRDLPTVDGCNVAATTIALPIPFWQPRLFLNIVFYEWRDQTNELIVACTSEETYDIERANGHLITGRIILGFTFDHFEKFTFSHDGMVYEKYSYGDIRGSAGKHTPAGWLKDSKPTFDYFDALKNDYLRRANQHATLDQFDTPNPNSFALGTPATVALPN